MGCSWGANLVGMSSSLLMPSFAFDSAKKNKDFIFWRAVSEKTKKSAGEPCLYIYINSLQTISMTSHHYAKLLNFGHMRIKTCHVVKLNNLFSRNNSLNYIHKLVLGSQNLY